MFQLNFILIGTLLHCVLSVSDYFFVVSPNVIRFDNEETVYVGVFGNMKNVAIKIWLEHQQKILTNKTVTVSDEEHPHETSISVRERDISHEINKPRLLKLCGQRQSDNQKACREVILSYQAGYIIVQTDKPIYTPRNTVKIRALALNESLQHIEDDARHMTIDIVSPSNLTLGRKTFPLTKPSGFYQNEFTLPPFPEIGVWTAKAFYKGMFETVATSRFYVEEYVLPTFDVKIEVSESMILPLSNTILRITVEAKYVYGKPVDGTARLTVNVTDITESRFILTMNRKPLENGKTEFSLDTRAILSSEALKDNFPDGSRLTVIATVFETATANEEAAYHDSTIFATYPFKFQFSRSNKYFRPGIEFYLKVDMLKANGDPADNHNITLYVFDNGECVNEGSFIKHLITIENGQTTKELKMPKESVKICFQVETSDGQKSDPFYVTAYKGKNQVLVIQDSVANKTRMRVTNNMQLNQGQYTGMMLMIVTRGKIAYAKYIAATPNFTGFIDNHIKELITPSARLIVFYIDDNTKEVVTDSVRIQVEERCRGTNLAVNGSQNLKPGKNDTLKITGEPLAWVGLNSMDKAVLLLNKGDILKKNLIFQALESHDLGCGPGSGKNNGDVLKNAGMTLVTNGVVTNDVDVNQYYQCGLKQRKRRDTECLYGAGSHCCEYGREYGETLFFEAAEEDRPTIDSYSKCYSSARNLTRDENIPTRCIMAYFHSCQNELEYLKSDVTHIVSKTIADITSYQKDMAALDDSRIVSQTRSNFSESFLFEEVLLNRSGRAEKMIVYPHSITNWMIQAIGISPNKGICIADPFEVEVFQDFFIQLELPYKATRYELLTIKATIFSYGQPGDPKKQARIYLEGADGLCYSGTPGQPSEPMIIDLGPNTAKTVTFPVVPIKAGRFEVTVTAVVTNMTKPDNIPQVDKIRKPLYVVHEGIHKQINILACLDPNNQMTDCASNKERVSTSTYVGRSQHFKVNLTLPNGYIHGTGSATGYLYGTPIDNIVRAIVNGVTNFFTMPSGCTEQTAASFAPNVFAMMYLKRTGQVTSYVEEIGNKHIREGVNREVSKFMKKDGSYYKYSGNKDKKDSSVWLTAFVAKLLCHSKKLVDGAVDEEKHLHQTIRWLNSQVKDGIVNEFSNIGRLEYVSMGNLNTSSPAMNSFWLITMLECGVLQEEIKSSVKSALGFIENQSEKYMTSEPYILAISTYVLALSNSKHKWTFKKWLGDIARKQNDENLFWGKDDGDNSYNVETTAYALLAMLKFDDLKTSGHIVRWLTTQQNAYGVFKSTQDTVVGLQALAEYSIRTFTPNVDLKIRLIGNGLSKEMNLTNQFELQTIVKIPVENEYTLDVKVDGTSGSGRLRIELLYNMPPQENETCPFNISNIEIGTVVDYDIDINIIKDRQCDVCGRCVNESSSAQDSLFTTPEPDNSVHSNFGRRKRQANTKNKKERCVRFTVSAKGEREHGMSMVLFGLETGVTVLKEDLKLLMEKNANLGQYEPPSDGNGYIAFYLNTLTSQPNDFVFRLVDEFNGSISTRQPATVTVFNYYQPEFKCLQMYNSASNVDTKVDIQCDDPNNKGCKCLQSNCSQPVEDDIMSRNQPADDLYKYTCNPEKANYAMSVKVVQVSNDSFTKSNIAEARVIRNIHHGANAKHHTSGTLVSFSWKKVCPFPSMTVNSTYYIIGKDDYQIVDHRFRYSLMGTALVIKFPEKADLRVTKVLENYVKLIGRGCSN